jgi:hypothetical protein
VLICNYLFLFAIITFLVIFLTLSMLLRNITWHQKSNGIGFKRLDVQCAHESNVNIVHVLFVHPVYIIKRWLILGNGWHKHCADFPPSNPSLAVAEGICQLPALMPLMSSWPLLPLRVQDDLEVGGGVGAKGGGKSACAAALQRKSAKAAM